MSRLTRVRSVVRVAELQEAQAAAAVAHCRHAVNEVLDELERVRAMSPPSLSAGSAADFMALRATATARAAALGELAQQVSVAEGALADAIDVHVSARQQTRSYDKLLERVRNEVVSRRDAAEQRLVDDLSASRHGRRS